MSDEKAMPRTNVFTAVTATVAAIALLLTNLDTIAKLYFEWRNPAVETAQVDEWNYYGSNDGNAVASLLTANRAKPETVWGHVQNTQYFHIWYQFGKEPVNYKYNYIPWTPGTPLNARVFAKSEGIVPLGFGTASGAPVQIYLEVKSK